MNMLTAHVTYDGGFRTESTHIRSGSTLLNDAPVDNHGKGEAFSPTDMLATSLATCLLTTMAIQGAGRGLVIDGATADVQKTMAAGPRRVVRVEVKVVMPAGDWSPEDRTWLEDIGRSCPVACSLHPDIEQDIHFEW